MAKKKTSTEEASSSFLKGRKKEYALWGLFLLFIFSVGWLRGYKPHVDWRGFLGKKEPLVILSNGSEWLTEDLVQKLSRKLRRQVRIEVIDDFTEYEARLIPMDSPSLAWMPTTWASAFSEQGLLGDFDGIRNEILQKLSPDFITNEEAQEPHFLPLLWRREKSGLRVEGFAVPHGADDPGGALKALKTLLSTEVALDFTRKSPAASTLRVLDENALPPEKKSRALRDLELKKPPLVN